MKLSLIMLSSL